MWVFFCFCFCCVTFKCLLNLKAPTQILMMTLSDMSYFIIDIVMLIRFNGNCTVTCIFIMQVQGGQK